MTTPTINCPVCGAAASGNFCGSCGAALSPRTCSACQAQLSTQARFCHRCGHPAPLPRAPGPSARAARERTAWVVAGILCFLLLGVIVLRVTRGLSSPVAPDMANPGAGGAADGGPVGTAATTPGPAGPAPDISRMTPRERFDRLFNRIMEAADQGDTVQVGRFLPMALGAYSQLDSIDVDARYHAAVLHLQAGDAPGARALADTILRGVPTHLFGYIVRGDAARLQNDSAAERRAQADFLAHYDAEMKAKRVEYLEHEPAIEEFKKDAEKGEGTAEKGEGRREKR